MSETQSSKAGTATNPLLALVQFVKDGASLLAAVAAFVFMSGALAVWSHDRMVGLPTAWTSYDAYVRVGATFVPDSIWSALMVINGWLGGALTNWSPAIIAALTVIVLLLMSRAPSVLKDLTASTSVFPYALLVVYFSVLVAGVGEANRLVGVLDRANTGLVLKSVDIPPEALQIVRDVRAGLSSDDRAPSTRMYGLRVIGVGALTAALFGLGWLKRGDLHLASTRPVLEKTWPQLRHTVRRATTIVAPLLSVTVVFAAVLLPAAYGVLRLPLPPPCVDLILSDGVYKNGFLLTDLATDPREIQLARWDGNSRAVVLEIYPRATVRTLSFRSKCGSFLAPVGGS